MSNETKHTPTPWQYDSDTAWVKTNDYLICGVYRIDKTRPEHSDARDANGDFIVRACNAHEDLLATLKHIADGPYNSMDAAEILEEVVRLAETAIAKAEGRA